MSKKKPRIWKRFGVEWDMPEPPPPPRPVSSYRDERFIDTPPYGIDLRQLHEEAAELMHNELDMMFDDRVAADIIADGTCVVCNRQLPRGKLAACYDEEECHKYARERVLGHRENCQWCFENGIKTDIEIPEQEEQGFDFTGLW